MLVKNRLLLKTFECETLNDIDLLCPSYPHPSITIRGDNLNSYYCVEILFVKRKTSPSLYRRFNSSLSVPQINIQKFYFQIRSILLIWSLLADKLRSPPKHTNLLETPAIHPSTKEEAQSQAGENVEGVLNVSSA